MMNATERALLLKKTIIKESIKNGFTENQAKGFFDIIIEYVEKLQNVRLSEKLTNEIVDEIIKFSNTWDSSKEVSYFFIATKFTFIKSWIYNIILEDKTYWYAKLRISQDNIQKSRMNTDDIEKSYITQKELEELIFNESPKPIYRIVNLSTMKKIHSLINDDIIYCTQEQFLSGVEAANFKGITIKFDNKFKEVIFRLQHLMEKEWYTETCKNMEWEKTYVSGRSVEFDGELNKLLPRKKRN